MVMMSALKDIGFCIDCGAALAESCARNRTTRCPSCGCRLAQRLRHLRQRLIRARSKAAAKPADMPERGG
jgi:DNA-directed RNA polymerase subunit RPC12/RpoP